jgi:hypothetical protein
MTPEMKNARPTKKGFFAMLRESFGKTGGCCCGPGETCGGPAGGREKAPAKEVSDSKETGKPGQP